MEERSAGAFRTISVKDLKAGNSYGYILDIDPASFEDSSVASAIFWAQRRSSSTRSWDSPPISARVHRPSTTPLTKTALAMKMYGGGDTLQEFKDLCPGLYLSVMDNANYYFFTGGGTVLTAIEQGSPYGLKPVQALIEAGKRPKGV